MANNRSASTSSAVSIAKPDEAEILTGVPVTRQADGMDLRSLCVSDLKLLKRIDPFMYYSIPGATNSRLSEQDLHLMMSGLSRGSSMHNLLSETEQAKPLHAPRNRLRSISDSHLFVERRRRISYESHLDEVMESIIGEMAELDAQYTDCKMRRSSSCSKVEEISVDRAQLVQVHEENDECRKPKCGSGPQDVLFSIVEGIWEDDCDAKESSDSEI